MQKSNLQGFALALAIATLGLSSQASAQFWKKKQTKPAPSPAVTDTTKKKDPPKLKDYAEVLKGFEKSDGFISVHRKDNKYYFEVPFSVLGRDIMIVSRISKASADMRNGTSGYAGDQIGETVYQLEKGPENKLFIRRISFSEYNGDSTVAMYRSVEKNNVMAIVEAFPILAFNKDTTSLVFDATDFVNSDNDVLYFQKKVYKDRAGMGSQLNEMSYLNYIHTFSTNMEINAVKTYNAGLNPAGRTYTVELNASVLLLPKKPMRPRMLDERVGYFAVAHKDYNVQPQTVKMAIYARRWRLEPKPEDVDKYLHGELVEPAKPIVFYIDPVTPKQWVPYLIQGVNDWQKAFERAGFKNAIYARVAPSKEEDSTWSIDDARHAAILYRPSEIANAMGPNVSDPRSGEILESHIFWYHNVMQLLQKWYLVQCGAVDPRARKPILDSALMGQLIRFVSSHEVGHTLGLMHNFGSSATVPVEKLRDKKWVEEHGHTPSIMDYARFNYVAQPEDSIGTSGLYPRINDYDKWAIEWGYRWYPDFKTPEEEKTFLTKVVTDSLKNPRLWFGNEMEAFDPRCQNEDLGDDAMKAGMYGIRNLQRILPHLVEWTKVEDDDQEELQNTYSVVFRQYYMYMGHVAKNIGGIYHTPKVGAQEGPLYVNVPYNKQKEAVEWLNKQVFQTPEWLNDTAILARLPTNFSIELLNVQKELINSLLTQGRMSRLINAAAQAGGKTKTYTIYEFLDDMNKGILSELYAGKNVDLYRRGLQKSYLSRLVEQYIQPDRPGLLVGPYNFPMYLSDMPGILQQELESVQALCKKAQQKGGLNEDTRIHLKAMADKIQKALDYNPMREKE